MLDAAEIERRTGWRVLPFEVLPSTNDEVAARRDAGHPPRLAVVADRQEAGRGRGGRRFESPLGGLYVSLLVAVPLADLPAPVTAAVALALRDAVARHVRDGVAIKWPNDLWIRRRKVAGILTEASLPSGRPEGPVAVVVGVGVNVDAVPAALSADVAAETTALRAHAPAPVRREDLLADLLPGVDRRLAELRRPDARAALDRAYGEHLALRGEPIRFLVGAEMQEGVFAEATIDRGIRVRSADGEERWWPSNLVREVRPTLR